VRDVTCELLRLVAVDDATAAALGLGPRLPAGRVEMTVRVVDVGERA
jgi:hypothetical protein